MNSAQDSLDEVRGDSRTTSLTLGCDEAAALLGMSRATFWKLHSNGKVPLPIRFSDRVVRWRRKELEAWVNAGCPPRDAWKWPE